MAINRLRARFGDFAWRDRVAWLTLVIPMLVALTTIHWLRRSYAPVPFMDQWGGAVLYEALTSGEVSFSDLFAQHNEHRILFPRLVFLADFAWLQGRNLINLAAIGVTQLLAGLLLLKLSPLSRAPPVTIFALAVALSLLFSLAQWENFFWGFQVQFVGVFCAGAWAIYFFGKATEERTGPKARELLLSLLLLAYATFNMANGVFAGFAMIGAAIVARRDWRAAAIVGLASGLLLALYLHGYKSMGHHAPPSLAFEHPVRFLNYLLAYLGNPFGIGAGPELAAGLGFVGMSLSVAMLVVVLRTRTPSAVDVTLLGIVLFVGLSAAVTSFGRLNFGIGQALSGRYATPALWFWAAHLLFWSRTIPVRWRWARGGMAAGLCLISAYLVMVQIVGGVQLLIVYERLQRGASALLSGGFDPEALRQLHPEPVFVVQEGERLRRLGLAPFVGHPPVGSSLAGAVVSGPKWCDGRFDAAFAAPEGAPAWRGWGWAWDTRNKRPIREIVIGDQTGRIVAIGLGGMVRKDVRQSIPGVRSSYTGWNVVFRNDLSGPLTAYGVLPDGNHCRLSSWTVPTS